MAIVTLKSRFSYQITVPIPSGSLSLYQKVRLSYPEIDACYRIGTGHTPLEIFENYRFNIDPCVNTETSVVD